MDATNDAPDVGGFWYSLTHPIDTVKNAATGLPTDDQLKQIEAGTYSDILRAGGSPAEAQDAADEIRTFNQTQQGGTADQALPGALTKGLFGTAAVVVIGAIVVLIVLHEVNT